jgi:hypothetical protein
VCTRGGGGYQEVKDEHVHALHDLQQHLFVSSSSSSSSRAKSGEGGGKHGGMQDMLWMIETHACCSFQSVDDVFSSEPRTPVPPPRQGS